MKLIENLKFETITSDLASLENEYQLDARLELYSCKTGTTTERKAYKSFVSTTSVSRCALDHSHTVPVFSRSVSCPAGGVASSDADCSGEPSRENDGDTVEKKVFWYLVATLNASYGIDGDFSDVQSQAFSRESDVHSVMDGINASFTTVLGASYERIKAYVWKAIDQAITLRDCAVYCFSPDPEYDPSANEKNLWKFWYFFYNRSLKRVCFFHCRALKSGGYSSESSEYFMNDDEK